MKMEMALHKCLLFTFVVASISAKEKPLGSSSEAREYLNRQLLETKIQIAKSYSQDPPQVLNQPYRWNRLWGESVDSDSALAVNFFNESFVLADDRVLRVEVEVFENVVLRQVASINQYKTIKFVKSTEYKGSLFLLVCQEDGSCNLNVGPNANELRHSQVIKHRGLPMDAAYFTRQNKLYLVVADNSGQFSIPSVIYHWTGTYMDVVAEIGTTGAVSVTTFNHKQSTIIVFAQNVQGRPKIGSEVFKFANGPVEKIQFLPTDGPTSVHRYEYDGKTFLLVINEFSPSKVFWWDGKEFLNWIEVPEIKSPTKVSIVYADGETLLLVSEQSTLSLYKIMNLAYSKLDLLEMKGGYSIVDFSARVKGKSIILVLVTKSDGNLYHIEPFELVIQKFSEATIDEPDGPLHELTLLDRLLEDRMPAIEEAHESWPKLLPFAENLRLDSPFEIGELIIESGSISEIFLQSPAEILTPTELRSGLEQIELIADSLLSRSAEFLLKNDTAKLSGTIFVDGDASFDEIHVDALSVDVFNDRKVEVEHFISYSKDQDFGQPLQGDKITISNLEIDSICGIPFENWMRKENSTQTVVELLADDVTVFKDTIFIQGDLSLDNIGASVLNNLDLDIFIKDLFIVGSNQRIKGNLFYKQVLNAYDLTINEINGIHADQLLTKNTNQKLSGNFLIKTLDVDELFVSTINDVRVNEAARISQENVILGQVSFRKLVVTEQFFVHENVSVRFDVRPIQIYGDVEVNGDLTLRDLVVPSGGSVYLEDRETDLDYLFANYWTKSTDQTITKSVKLSAGITIDDLNSEYLNGYREEDFLYTTAEEIPEKFGPLNFKRLEIDGALRLEGGGQPPAESVFSISSENTLFVNQKIFIKNLSAGNLNAKSYNKIPVEYIVGGKSGATISGRVKYENLFVSGELRAKDATVGFLNGKYLPGLFAEVLYRDGNYAIDYFEVEKLVADNVGLEAINGFDMAEFYSMLIYKDVTKVRSVTVDGDLEVVDNLRVDLINDLTAAEFVDNLAKEDVLLREADYRSGLKSFVVLGNLQANLIRSIKIEDAVADTLSRTKTQTIRGRFSAGKVQANYLFTPTINGVNITGLKLVSDPLILQEDVVFSSLIVRGDVIAGYLNDMDIDETYDKALSIPFTEIKSLEVKGKISWENSSPELSSFSHLLRNAAMKNTDQTISGGIVFANNVEAIRVTRLGSGLIAGVDIASVVSDTVVVYKNEGKGVAPIKIGGEKYLGKGLTVSDITVSGDVGFRLINDWDIIAINSTVVRKFERQTIAGKTIFRESVFVESLEVEGTVDGLDPRGVATFGSSLPKNTRFAHLEVRDELRTEKLDGINLEEFLRGRITLDGNHDVYVDVVFQDSVAATENAAVAFINGIEVSDFAISGNAEVQSITGEKIFLKDLIVRGNVAVGSLNGVQVTEEYRNGVFNNENFRIKGDIIFSSDIETRANVSVSGLVNGIKLSDLLYGDVSADAKKMMENLELDQLAIDATIDRSLNATRSLADVFFYFDTQRELVIRAPNIRKVQSFVTESMTRLNLYGFENGERCGLPDACLCPAQYVAELLDYECKIWRVSGARTVYNFHDPDSRFGVNVVANGVSTGQFCTRENPASEFIEISWILPGELITGHVAGKIMSNNKTLEINGYLSDAKAFTIGAEIYLVLAIYYNAVVKSHDVPSLVYRIDLIGNKIELAQKLPTSGAIALEIFTTRLRGTHLLVACAADPAESQLYRFNARDSKFELLRTFWTGGSLNVKSLIHGEESFVLLDDPLANSVHIFKYNIHFDNYNFYQSIFQSSLVKNIEVFYSGEISASDAYVIVTTEEGRFFVYEYMFFGGFQLRFEQWLDGVQTMASFYYSGRRYIFAGTIANSTVYRIVQQGPLSNWYN